MVDASRSTTPPGPDVWLADPTCGAPLRLHLGPQNRLLADAAEGEGAPVVVLSIPKAGTYLLARLLERLGLRDTELHLSNFSLSDYRGMSVEQKRLPGRPEHGVAIPVSAGLIGRGQFVVGHVKPEPWGRAALRGFRRIFLKRELAAATLSNLRFCEASGRAPAGAAWVGMKPSPEQALAFLADQGRRLFADEYEPMAAWLDEPDAFVLSFEDLMGDHGRDHRARRLAELARFLGRESDLEALLTGEVLGQPTKTLSSGRTDVATYWSPDVEAAFAALGCETLNARLGYPGRSGL